LWVTRTHIDGSHDTPVNSILSCFAIALDDSMAEKQNARPDPAERVVPFW